MIDSDILLNPETAMKIVNLTAESHSGEDLTLLIENKGSVIEGECQRKFEDGKKRMDVRGYLWLANSTISPGANSSKVSTSDLIVVRQCDAASASIASLLKSQSEDLTVVLSRFKASGDDLSTDREPTLELQINKGRVCFFAIVTPNSATGAPSEIIAFAHQGIEIRSAAQSSTGQRGAVRTCTFNS